MLILIYFSFTINPTVENKGEKMDSVSEMNICYVRLGWKFRLMSITGVRIAILGDG